MGNVPRLLGLLALLVCVPASVMACELAPVRPAIHIHVSETPVAFDLSQSIEDLNQVPIDTKSPYPSSYHTDVGGVMSGEVAVEHRLSFHKDKLGENFCVSLGEVNITITTRPKIYIASDFQDQTCWFKQTFLHEAKHVEIDRALIEKYEGQFTDGLNMILMEPADYSSGWVESSAMAGAQYQIQFGVERALEVLFAKMVRERQEKQQEVDSLHEYTRISRACQVSSS